MGKLKKISLVAYAMLVLFQPDSLKAVHYEMTPLVSNLIPPAPYIDPNLLRPWGLFFSPNGSFWVVDNGSNLSMLYSPTGNILTSIINTSPNPTGAKLNSSQSGFLLAPAKSARFLFSTEGGLILGYNSTLSSANTVVALDNSASRAVYKGLELITSCCGKSVLLATDFRNAKIDLFDDKFDTYGFIFNDSSLPSGYAPFNIKKINNLLYVTYAKQLPPENEDDQPGPGNGFVDVFTVSGTFIKHLVSQENLNSPWGLALAPKNFGEFSNALLVGNFGDGKINAYNLSTGAFLGQLTDSGGAPIVIEGLWSLEFNAKGVLYFTAAPNDEVGGLVGTISPL